MRLSGWSHFIHASLPAWQPHLDPTSHGERSEMNKRGWWGRLGFNLFGPRPAAHSIRLPLLSVCSCEVPSLNCNQREAREVRDVLGQRERRDRDLSLSLSLALLSSLSSVCILLSCNRLDHKLESIHPISRSINVSRVSSPTHTGHINEEGIARMCFTWLHKPD